MRIHTEADLDTAISALIAQAPIFAEALKVAGTPPLRRRAGGLAGLAQIICGQQISAKAGAAIFARMEAYFPTLDAATLAKASEEDFRACGLSAPKFRTLRAASDAILAGTLDLHALEQAEPEAIHIALTAVKGLGPWSADIYALFCLGHADAFAPGDLALQIGAQELLALPARPSAKELAALADSWRPHRAAAARLLWAYYGARRAGGDGVPLRQ